MNRNILFSLTVLVLAALACSTITAGTSNVVGSGKVVSETRNVGSFTSVELRSSAHVKITLGTPESVTVKADDNIVPLIETTVQDGALVIGSKPFTSMTTSNGVEVTIVTKSLQGLTLSGSGNINVSGMTGPGLDIELPGSGDITVSGAADHVTISLAGSGNVVCNELKAHAATATVAGSGTVTVYADQSLDASIAGSGTIRYEGNPAKVTKNITGSGTITP